MSDGPTFKFTVLGRYPAALTRHSRTSSEHRIAAPPSARIA